MPEQENKKPFSGSISLVRVADGESAGSFFIQTNTDAIYKYETKDGVSFMHGTITFKVKDITAGTFKENFEWRLRYLDTNGSFQELLDSENFIGFSNEDLVRSTLYFYLQDYYDFLSASDENNEHKALKTLIENNSLVLLFTYLESGNPLTEKVLNTQNGVTADMAKLNVNATNITQIVDKVNLTLNANGLALKNGDFVIYKEIEGQEPERIFYMNTDSGNLTLKGDIYADNGYFKGAIEAISGEIGGFKIKEGELVSSNGSLQLQGKNGKIIAQNIELGTGAVINDHISFSYEKDNQIISSYIRNPGKRNGLWLEANGIKLYADGLLKLGAIEMYGGDETQQAYLTSPEYTSSGRQRQGKWRINQDGTAYFDTVDLNHINVQNSVLQIGTVQSVGSLMLFKDSWTVINVEGAKVCFDGLHSLEVNDWVYDGSSVYQIKVIPGPEDEDKNWVILDRNYSSDRFILTKFGKSESDYILSIFGESTNNQSLPFASGNSLTLSTFKLVEGNVAAGQGVYEHRLIIGDLNSSGISNISGIGLYADNVYLNGALVTRNTNTDGEESYAGINTGSNSIFRNSKDNDKSPTVIWAGATLEDKIGEAPFQVSRNGSLYASKAIIENSVVAGANIYGSNIYATALHGWRDGSANELSIYDSSSGIVFRKEEDDSELFKIYNSGLSVGENQFVSIEDDVVQFTGKFKTTGNLNIEDQKIFTDQFSINFMKNDLRLGQNESEEVIIQKGATIVKNNFSLGEKMEYKQIQKDSVVVGYDLYVY